MASPPQTGGQLLSNANNYNNNVKKCGYLKKQKHGHKRFFVLKGPSDGSPARLEYYENEKKWKNKSAAKRAILLDSCLNINKRADAKHKHLIALYTKDEYFAVAAENDQEQENWYQVLTDLMNEGRVYDGSCNSASSLVGFDEASYGMITPVNAAYKEVWQVNLKSKGLGHTRNLTGVYRLCLSSRSISFVKLNSEVASVSLQLMNIRRCGHSDSFFFIEVGRSASTGPGELWMQADDSVVAQNIHETILEAMKAMKELSEFRPRSKSQSSGTNPISVPSRRHLNNLPPSQTGLLRRSRTDSIAATSPVTKFSSCRFRTASEGDGTMTRPMSVTGSPISPCVNRTQLSRSNTVTARPCHTFESPSLQHSKSMSMPVSHSPPSATSPISLSSSSGNGSNPENAPRPSSCSVSVSGSPSDAGFISCDDCASSPGEGARGYLMTSNRSNTPESFTETPPSQDGSDLHGYMIMERRHTGLTPFSHHRLSRAGTIEDGLLMDLEKAYRKRTHSLTMPHQKRAPAQVSSASLDEYTLMRATYTTVSQNLGGEHSSNRSLHTASPKVTYPEDYGDIEIGSLLKSPSGQHPANSDDGYMPMTLGVAPHMVKDDHYMPMSPMCVSAPKQIINPRTHHPLPSTSSSSSNGFRTHSPGSGGGSLEDSGYMKMLCGSKLSTESSDSRLGNGEYLNMSPVAPSTCSVSLTPPDYFLASLGPVERHQLQQQHSLPLQRVPYSFNSLPRSYKAQQQHQAPGKQQLQQNANNDQYVMMSPRTQRIAEEPLGTGSANIRSSSPPQQPEAGAPAGLSSSPSGPSPVRQSLVHRGRLSRPSRLSLDTLPTLPSMTEHPLPTEPKSPGEYVNIDFGAQHLYKASSSSASAPQPCKASSSSTCSSSSSSSSSNSESPLTSSLGFPNGPTRGVSPSLSDYMNVDLSAHSPKRSAPPALDLLDSLPELCACEDKDEAATGEAGEGVYSLALPVVPVCAGNKDDYTEMKFDGSASSPAQPVGVQSVVGDRGPNMTSPTVRVQRLTLGDTLVGGGGSCGGMEAFLLPGGSPPMVVSDPDRGAKVIRADPQGRRRHSSETFSSTTTVTPVFPSFAHPARRHASASVENVPATVRDSESTDEDGSCGSGSQLYSANSPMCRQTSAGFQNGLNYIALNLMDEGLPACDTLVRFKATSSCKGGINGIHASPYASLGFKETATAVKD